MQKRAVRRIVLALLVATALGATYLTWRSFLRFQNGLIAERDVDSRLDRIAQATAALGAAQQAYVAPGQQRGDALTRASVLVQQVYDDAAALRLHVRSGDSPRALLTLGSSLDALVNLDDRAREHLRQEQELMAADLLYTEARQALEGMAAQVDALRAAEARAADEDRRTLFTRQAQIVGGAAAVWFLGVLVLIPVRATASREEPVDPAASMAASEAPQATDPHSIDLNAAARVCSELARLPGETGLAPVLARTARVLDASGVVVWLGAGEELFPAVGHGYGPRTLARLGPIARDAENATAVAWRTGELAVVPGTADGSGAANGAIVAPLIGSGGCFGVLAAEVRHGRETDPDTRAVAMVFAAQLATVVSPWPAPSEVEGPTRSEAGPSELGAASA